MKLEWDFSEFEAFANRLNNAYRLETALRTATQNIAKVLHKYLLELTPIDTGNLRKMWSAGDNLAFTVERVNNGFQVTLINEAINKRSLSDNYPEGFMYGVAVNDGHRSRSGGWVVGKFFVEKSIAITSEWDLETVVYKELLKWWEGLLNG